MGSNGHGFTFRSMWAALYTLQCIVEERDVDMFGTAIELSSIILDNASGLISIKDYAKIVTGLKIMVNKNLFLREALLTVKSQSCNGRCGLIPN